MLSCSEDVSREKKTQGFLRLGFSDSCFFLDASELGFNVVR